MKKLLAGSLPLLSYLSVATPSFAANLCPGGESGSGDFSNLCSLNLSGGLLGYIITAIFVIAIVIALFYLIWGGIKWLLSGGDKGKVDAARSHIVAAIVGLVIIFLSYFILSVIVPFFVPGFSFSNVQLPSIGN